MCQEFSWFFFSLFGNFCLNISPPSSGVKLGGRGSRFTPRFDFDQLVEWCPINSDAVFFKVVHCLCRLCVIEGFSDFRRFFQTYNGFFGSLKNCKTHKSVNKNRKSRDDQGWMVRLGPKICPRNITNYKNRTSCHRFAMAFLEHLRSKWGP